MPTIGWISRPSEPYKPIEGNVLARVETEYNNIKPEIISQLLGKRSLECRMQTILTAVGKLRGCLRHIESFHPSGASEDDIMIRAKILLTRDKKYKKGFKFDLVWSIFKDMQKFTDNDSATSAFQRQSDNFASSQEDPLTPESPTSASPGLSSFSLNITNDDVGSSSSQQPNTIKDGQQLIVVFFFF
ncbi:hypothetical protein Dsin_032110 [Dipteronia sinensis]|uniref:No apical meristem-associated C-terminal domain-containing protein n=1 Tax=Dipteronia sinensis TaxID=43782 RepID=A0AAD9ZP22_9ROSI|nr:hypothetical protein Dsin_032110 [Dipteronia sinensis]